MHQISGCEDRCVCVAPSPRAEVFVQLSPSAGRDIFGNVISSVKIWKILHPPACSSDHAPEKAQHAALVNTLFTGKETPFPLKGL